MGSSVRLSVLVAAAAAAVVAALGFYGLSHRTATQVSPADTELAAIVRSTPTRPLKGRLSSDVVYRPTAIRMRAGDSADPGAPPEAFAHAARMQQQADARRDDLRHQHAYALSLLEIGRRDTAIDILRTVTAREPANAAAWNDLAAALYERGSPENLVAALDAVQRSLRLAPTPAAHFNRAMTLASIAMPADTVDVASAQYFAGDERSAWAEELRALRRRIPPAALADSERIAAALTAPTTPREDIDSLVADDPEAVRTVLETRLLADWASACLRRTPSAAEAAARAHRTADALARRTGDRLYANLAADLGVPSCARDDRRALARAIQSYASGRLAYDGERAAEAASAFAAALDGFAALRSPMAAPTRLYLAIDAYYRGDLARSLAALESLRRDGERRGFRFLVARVEWMQGVAFVSQARHSDARAAYESALARFHQLGDRQSAAAVEALLAQPCERLGDYSAAWSHHAASLREFGRLPLRRRHTTLVGAARAALAQDRAGAGTVFADAAVDNARRWGRAGAEIEALLLRARAMAALDERATAEDTLRAAGDRLARVADPLLRGRFASEILLAEADLRVRTDPRGAIDAVERVLPRLADTGMAYERARAYLAKGRAAANAHDTATAEDSLTRGVAVVEDQRLLLNPVARISAFDQVWDLYGELIRVQADARRAVDALATADRSRVRSLIDAIHSEHTSSDVAAAARRLPPGAVMLYFISLPDELLLWTISAERIELDRSPIARTSLADLVRRSVEASRAVPESIRDTTALYDALIGPARERLVAARMLLIVPDGPLHDLPFAALRNGATGRLLIEDHAISIAPGLRLLQTIRPAAGSRRTLRGDDVLLVSAPDTMDGSRPLPRLDGAHDEIAALRGMFQGAAVLEGADATPARFATEASTHPVVHYAGHAIVNREFPELSRLVMGDRRHPVAWTAAEIARESFRAADLVVLAACDTAAGPVLRGEGALNLARPFLAAGARSVVASLWPVPDREASAFFRVFYQRLQAGATPSEALQAAQISALKSGMAPSTWAAFVLVGSS
jgi:CHAT domain-containing protein